MKDIEIFKLIFDLQCDIICNSAVGSKIVESPVFEFTSHSENFHLGEQPPSSKYIIGNFNGHNVEIDPLMHWNDIRIFDSDGKELLDLNKLGFTTEDLM